LLPAQPFIDTNDYTMQERELIVLNAASMALNSYLDAVSRDENFEIKKQRWVELKRALSALENISPELKKTFIRTHNLPAQHLG
jgi:hypothetical protein